MDEKKNNEGYADGTAYAAMRADERKQKAYYVFKTMISVARLAGFFVNDNLTIEDNHGTKYHSNFILKKRDRKPDV